MLRAIFGIISAIIIGISSIFGSFASGKTSNTDGVLTVTPSSKSLATRFK